jgi:multidrug efflux pump subunit AcrA (membrane-fusion protein)
MESAEPAIAAPSPLVSRWLQLWPTAFVALLTLVWGLQPTIPVKVRGSGLLTAPESRRLIYARGAGEVQELKVAVGAEVSQGQLLLSLDRVGQAAPGGGLVAGPDPRVTSAQLLAVDKQLLGVSQQGQAFAVQSAALELRRQELQTTNKPVLKQLQALDALRKDDVVARYSPLWVGAQDLFLRNRADIAAIEAQQAQLQAQRAELAGRAGQLQAQRALLSADVLSQEVFSPAAGRILDLAVVPGQAVIPGQKLGSIAVAARGNGPLALVLFTAADATRLKIGDRISLDPQLLSRDSFGGTGERYGSVDGELIRLSKASVDLADVATQLGAQEEAANLMANARQRSFGDGGDLTAQLPNRAGAPLVMGLVRLKQAPTPTGLAWSRGQGPSQALPLRTPLHADAEVEQRSLFSYVLPFWRWLAGARP